MNELWLSSDWIGRLAGSLLHFLWQGALLAFLAAVLLRLLARRSANARYTVAVIALGLMLVAPCITFLFYPETGRFTLEILEYLGGKGIGSLEGGGPATLWTQWIVVAWAAGVGASAIRLMTGWLLSLHLVRSARSAVPPALERPMRHVTAALLSKGPSARLRIGDRVTSPVVFGWLRPVVLLPATTITGLSEDQLLAVLAHEVAHIRRHDFLVNALQRVVESALFYHPGVWWLSSRIRAEREHCCDDLAVTVCGDRFLYAEALIELERGRAAPPALAVPAAAGRLTARIRRVLGGENPNRDWQPAAGALLLVAVCAVAGVSQGGPIPSPTLAAVPPPLPPVEVLTEAALLPREAPPLEGALGAIAAIATAQVPQAAETGEEWVTTWGTTQRGSLAPSLNNQTIRMFVRASVGGQSARVRLSNADSTTPVVLDEVRIALRDLGSRILPGSDRLLRFGGRPDGAVEIPAGEEVTSDPVDMEIAAGAELAVTIYAANETRMPGTGIGGLGGYSVAGNQASATGLTGATRASHLLSLTGIDVLTSANASVVVVVTGALRGNRRWTALLAARLQANEATKNVVVIATEGDRSLLTPATLADSLDRIVGGHPGVQRLMLCADFVTLLSGKLGEVLNGPGPADGFISMFSAVVDEARARGLVTIGCTMTPYQSDRFDAVRVAVNEWIRSGGAFDAVVDFDAVARDAARPDQLSPEFVESGLDLNERGDQALAESIDLSLFAP